MKNIHFIQLTFLISLTMVFQEGKAQQLPASLSKLVEQSFLKFPKVDEMNDQVKLNEGKVELGKAGYWPIATGDISYRRMFPTDPISISTGSGEAREIHIMPANNYNQQCCRQFYCGQSCRRRIPRYPYSLQYTDSIATKRHSL